MSDYIAEVFDAAFVNEIKADLRLMKKMIPELQEIYRNEQHQKDLKVLGEEFDALDELFQSVASPN